MKLGTVLTSSDMEKPTIITAEVPVTQATGSGKKSMVNSKVIAISVAAVCITVAVIAGFVFAFKYHAETTEKVHDMIVRELDVGGRNEVIEEDPMDRSKMYTMHNADGSTHYVLYDFIKRMKIVKRDNDNCIVSAMNHTETDVEDANGQPEQNYLYHIDSEPVLDKSFLPERGQELCKNQHVYWAFPSCDMQGLEYEEESSTNNVQKRATTYQYCHVSWRGYCAVSGCGYTLRGRCTMIVYETCNSFGRCSCNFYWWC